MAEKNDEFKGLKLSKDLKDFYYHCSISLKPGFFVMFEEELRDFIKRKKQKEAEEIMNKFQRKM